MKNVSVKVFNQDGQLIGPVDLPRVEKSDAEALRWYRLAAANGSRDAIEILRQRGVDGVQ